MFKLPRLASMSRWASVRLLSSTTARRGSMRRGVKAVGAVAQADASNAAVSAMMRMVFSPGGSCRPCRVSEWHAARALANDFKQGGGAAAALRFGDDAGNVR